MHQEFDPFNPDPNSESYLPEAESARPSKLRFWIHGRSFLPKTPRKKKIKTGDIEVRHALADLDPTTRSTEAPHAQAPWGAYMPRISEDDETRHRTGATSTESGHTRMNSEASHDFSGSPRKWYKFH